MTPPRRRVSRPQATGNHGAPPPPPSPQLWTPEVGASSWAPVALESIVAGVLKGEIIGPVPKLLRRTDGKCLLYPGQIHSIAGEPETGKGWISLSAAVSVIEQGGNVLYVDLEDTAESIITRLFSLGLNAEAIVEHFTYVRPDDQFSDAALRLLLDARSYDLAVIDGLTEAYSLLGLGDKQDDVAQFLKTLARPMADRGAAVLLIDHVARTAINRAAGRSARSTSLRVSRSATSRRSSALRVARTGGALRSQSLRTGMATSGSAARSR